MAGAVKVAGGLAREIDYDGLTLTEANTVNRVLAETLRAARMPRLKEVRTVPDWDNGIAGEGAIGLGIKALRALSTASTAEHSMAYFADQTEALVRHEVGHIVAQRYADRLADLLPRQDWERAYGVTARARDWWDECVAENFALYSAGRIDVLHPDMVNAFERITRYRWR
jgi:hypothetical protein